MSGQARKLPFEIAVALGNVAGISCVQKFGENPDIDTTTDPEDVWDYGGTYTFTADGGAPYYISSSDATDTQDVTLFLLTEDASGNWNEETVTVTLAGQTKTAISPLSGDDPVRIYRAFNVGTTDFAGDVYVYEDDSLVAGVPQTANKVRAQIRIGNNQTLMCIYTIPSNKVGIFMSSYYSTVGKGGAKPIISWKARPHGGVFQVKNRIGLEIAGSSWFSTNYSCLPVLSAKTDIKITVDEVDANDTAIAGGFDLFIKDS